MKGRAKTWRLGEGAAWGVGAAVFAMGACVPLAGAGYVLDLGANLAAQGLGVGCVVALGLAARRKWGGLALAGVGCVLMAWPLTGRPWTAPGAPGATPAVRILVFNSSANAGDAGKAMALIAEADADVVVLTEPSADLLDRIRASPEIGGRYPGFILPERAAGGYLLVLSAWAQSPVLGEKPRDVARRGLRVMRIERPEGPFVLVALHPDSPRSPGEWAKGNALTEEAARLVTDVLANGGLPVVVAADLNSTPSGWRSRRLGSAGLRRAKPVLAGGTYPAGWPRALRIAIDDVWMDGGEVLTWRALAGGGSDHAPVLVTAIPGASTRAGRPIR